eukprot:jgi/Botrbrau1/23567/Bobra.0141s0032.3
MALPDKENFRNICEGRHVAGDTPFKKGNEGTHVVACETLAYDEPNIKSSGLRTEADIRDRISSFLLSLPFGNSQRDATIEMAVEERLLQVMLANTHLQSTLSDWVAVAGELQDVVVRQSDYLRLLLGHQSTANLSYPFPYSGSEDELVQLRCVALDRRNELSALKETAKKPYQKKPSGFLSRIGINKGCQTAVSENGMLEMQIMGLQAEHIRLKDALVHAELEIQRLRVLVGRPAKPDVQALAQVALSQKHLTEENKMLKEMLNDIKECHVEEVEKLKAKIASDEAEAEGIQACNTSLKDQHAEIKAKLAECLEEVTSLKEQRDKALEVSAALSESLADSQTCTCSAQESAKKLNEELESTRSAMVKQAMVCAELQHGLSRKSSKVRQQRRVVHQSLDMSWILRANLPQGGPSENKHPAASNSGCQASTGTGHVIFGAMQDGTGFPINQPVLATRDTAGGGDFCVKEAPLDISMVRDGRQTDGSPAVLRHDVECNPRVHAANSVVTHENIASRVENQAGLCSACLERHLVLLEKLEAQHTITIKRLQTEHSALLSDAQALCEDWQAEYEQLLSSHQQLKVDDEDLVKAHADLQKSYEDLCCQQQKSTLEGSRDSVASAEERHRQEIIAWAKTCEDLQEDLFIARTRVTEVESQVTSLQHGNFVLNSQLLDVADGGQQKAGSSLADATWLRDVKTQLEDMQVLMTTLSIHADDLVFQELTRRQTSCKQTLELKHELKIREDAECGLQALVEALQEDTSSTKARLLDCQDMLAELQAFSEDRMIELAAVKAESEDAHARLREMEKEKEQMGEDLALALQNVHMEPAVEERATIRRDIHLPVQRNISIQLRDLAKELCHEARCRARAEARAEEIYHMNTMMQAHTMEQYETLLCRLHLQENAFRQIAKGMLPPDSSINVLEEMNKASSSATMRHSWQKCERSSDQRGPSCSGPECHATSVTDACGYQVPSPLSGIVVADYSQTTSACNGSNSLKQEDIQITPLSTLSGEPFCVISPPASSGMDLQSSASTKSMLDESSSSSPPQSRTLRSHVVDHSNGFQRPTLGSPLAAMSDRGAYRASWFDGQENISANVSIQHTPSGIRKPISEAKASTTDLRQPLDLNAFHLASALPEPMNPQTKPNAPIEEVEETHVYINCLFKDQMQTLPSAIICPPQTKSRWWRRKRERINPVQQS